MDLAAQLTEHLQALSRTGSRELFGADVVGGLTDLAAGLAYLAGDLQAQVPSCVAISILLTAPAGELTVSLPATLICTEPDVVLASLALPLAVPGRAALLLLQATRAGAFVLLADDWAGLRDPADPPALLDQHLALVADPTASRLGADLTDLRVVEQAVGALIEQGWPAPQAHHELTHRAAHAQLPTPALARQLLAALLVPSQPGDQQ